MMVEKTKPNITFMLEYSMPHASYVDYTNREKATELEEMLQMKEDTRQLDDVYPELLEEIEQTVPEQSLSFENYIDYMNRSFATRNETVADETPLFNQHYFQAPKQEVDRLKKQLNLAYENQSLLWKGVISFDNEFLAKQGLYDKESGRLDQRTVKEIVRDAMPFLLKREGISESAFWWGDIHLNTKHIHVHIGISEIESAREKIYYAPRRRLEVKGNFSQKSIKSLKSNVYHGLLNDKAKANILRQEQIIANLKTDLLEKSIGRAQPDRTQKFLLEQAYNHLPIDTKWRYGSNAKDFKVSKFFLDKYIDSYFQNEGKVEYQTFQAETLDFLKEFEQAYTSKESGREYEKLRNVEHIPIRTTTETSGYQIQEFMARRELDLRERIGNRILKYFKDSPPDTLEKNLAKFSRFNQNAILEQFPEASLLKTKPVWERMGYLIEREQPIEVSVPVFKKNDKGEDTKEIAGFTTKEYYDVLQTHYDAKKSKPSINELLLFSKEELAILISAAKEAGDEDANSVQELGIYRYALKLRSLEEQRIDLMVRQQLLRKIDPLLSDQAFVSFKQEEAANLVKLIDLKLKPKWRLTPNEKKAEAAMEKQWVDVVNLPIKQATTEVLAARLPVLEKELVLANESQDPSLFSLIKAKETSKDAYLNEIEAKITILKIKHTIGENNSEISNEVDSRMVQQYTRENGKLFNELKLMYQSIDIADSDPLNKTLRSLDLQTESRYSQNISNEVQLRNASKFAKTNQAQGKAQISGAFMNGLSSVLTASSGSRSAQAFKRKVREDDRDEREEKQREQRR